VTIYILDNDPELCAQYLDERSLTSCIKDIAQVLCEVHRYQYRVYDKRLDLIPLKHIFSRKDIKNWTKWARQCRANYMYLVYLGLACAEEWNYRFSKPIELHEPCNHKVHKFIPIISWARDNVPDLPIAMADQHNNYDLNIGVTTPPPLVMPNKYLIQDDKLLCEMFGVSRNYDLVLSYQNYYQEKLRQQKWKYYSKRDSSGEMQHYRSKLEPVWTRRNKPEWLEI